MLDVDCDGQVSRQFCSTMHGHQALPFNSFLPSAALASAALTPFSLPAAPKAPAECWELRLTWLQVSLHDIRDAVLQIYRVSNV